MCTVCEIPYIFSLCVAKNRIHALRQGKQNKLNKTFYWLTYLFFTLVKFLVNRSIRHKIDFSVVSANVCDDPQNLIVPLDFAARTLIIINK